MHYADAAQQEAFVNAHTHTHIRLLHLLWELRYGDIRRHASKFTTSSTIQRKAAPHRSEALSERRHFVTPSTDECMRTLMWFVWNSGTCISFFSFLPANLSVRPIWPQKKYHIHFSVTQETEMSAIDLMCKRWVRLNEIGLTWHFCTPAIQKCTVYFAPPP